MSVADAGYWENNVWTWDVQNLFSEEDEDDIPLVQFLTDLILHYDMVQDVQDVFVWVVNDDEGFSVKSCAREIRIGREGTGVGVLVLNKLKFMWNLEAPS